MWNLCPKKPPKTNRERALKFDIQTEGIGTYPWIPKPWKMKVSIPRNMGYNPEKWRLWLPMVKSSPLKTHQPFFWAPFIRLFFVHFWGGDATTTATYTYQAEACECTGCLVDLGWIWLDGSLYDSNPNTGQIIATSHELTPNGGLVREIPLFQGNLGWWNIIIWPETMHCYFREIPQHCHRFVSSSIPPKWGSLMIGYGWVGCELK